MPDLKEISSEQLKKLKPFLDEMIEKNEQPEFITGDPVLFMHVFEQKEDRTLAGFFAALMAWGQRGVILNKTEDLLQRMNFQPAAFIRNFKDDDRANFTGWKHRTFKPTDIYWLVKTLQKILDVFNSFEAFWSECYVEAKKDEENILTVFHHKFFSFYPQIHKRTYKHIANPSKNSSCKRLNMYLRWVIRKNSLVDPGIMAFMLPSALLIPLDVHVARQSRKLGLLTRRYNDWKATVELTRKLRVLDPTDPTKYDFALFGLGVDGQKIPKEFILNEVLTE